MLFNYHYKKPTLHDGDELIIKDGRHPVIERNLPVGETYITNDLELNKTEQQIIILTGPNMSGKSCVTSANSSDNVNGSYGKFCASR